MAVPLTFCGVSRRLAGVPISLKSSGRLSATLSGTGRRAASTASSPYLARRPVGAWSTSPFCARQDAEPRGVYRGRDEIHRIAGAIKATHPDFRYRPITEPAESGNGGLVRWISGRPGEAPAY